MGHNRFIKRVVAIVLAAAMLAAVFGGSFAYAAESGTVTVTGSSVNIRSGAGTGYSKVGLAYKNSTYSYLGSGKDSSGRVWYKIQYNASTVGWITSQYSKLTSAGIGTTNPSASNPSASTGTVTVTGSSVNVRSGAGTGYSKVGLAYKNSTYTCLGSGKDSSGRVWYKIQYSSSTIGWITSQYSKLSAANSSPAPSTPAPSGSPAQNYVNQIAAAYGADGVQVALIDNGVVTDTYNYGWATRNSVAMTSDHKIRVASISKVAVAISAMKMQEQGIIDINANIGTYWGASPAKAVTLKNLLNHTSSLKELGCSSTRAGTLSQLRSSANYTSYAVGSRWVYNNYAIGVAGSTLEVASGQPLTYYARLNVFNPIGMDAAFSPGGLRDTGNLATLYYADGSVARSAAASRSITGSPTPGNNASAFAGGLTCSAKDLARMIAMLANDGTYGGVRVLTPESVAAIESRMFNVIEGSHSFVQCMPLRYKAGLYGESELYYHTGNAYGVLALVSYNPGTGDGVVVVTTGASATRDSQGVYAVCSKITEYMYANVI